MSGITADLSGKVALVTGGGRGIGRAIAVALAGCGARVAVASRTLKEIEETRQIIAEKGGECLAIPADVTRVEAIYELVEKAYSWHNRLDILVNCAGINIAKFAVDVTEEDWDRVLDTNLKGTFFCCQAAGKKMIAGGGGRIINISSQMAHVGYYKRAAYCSSKGGVAQLTKVLAVEWAPHNVNVNCVAPTFLETPLTAPMFEDKDFYNDVIRRIPLGKIGKPEDVVGAVIYLASDAANMVTGSSILVDGGWVAW
ncbi:MAG: glucose 1-dehydrogenase [Pelotomaculum sp.]|uniref:Dehydrogenases with different specificities n=1 Tax=Pelotomaculum thermopropionicum (strain DSM 13744 / JCM 10971 / SI) TaxID=370438 RepID=A5CY54_PELTS|nr:glucose 1-dehydrogenase [Pelotomaculum sp.]BAF61075.1 dehydrogenases with different specificities [Pelotomaculum thermopropionicum SI]